MSSCCFIGHKLCDRKIEEALFDTIEKLIIEYGVNKFYVGTQGGFDKIVYENLCKLEKMYKIKIYVVLAYLRDKNSELKYYDVEKTIFPDILTKTPLRYAIRRRNTYMIDNSNYVITFLNSKLSNTFTNIEEAIRKKKKVINLGDLNI